MGRFGSQFPEPPTRIETISGRGFLCAALDRVTTLSVCLLLWMGSTEIAFLFLGSVVPPLCNASYSSMAFTGGEAARARGDDGASPAWFGL